MEGQIHAPHGLPEVGRRARVYVPSLLKSRQDLLLIYSRWKKELQTQDGKVLPVAETTLKFESPAYIKNPLLE